MRVLRELSIRRRANENDPLVAERVQPLNLDAGLRTRQPLTAICIDDNRRPIGRVELV